MNCCWPLAMASNVTAELTRAPSGPAADALTEVPRPETSATVTFVRKLLPRNAPENVSGNVPAAFVVTLSVSFSTRLLEIVCAALPLDVLTVWGKFYGSTVPLDRKAAPSATPVQIALQLDFKRVWALFKEKMTE